MLLPVCGRSRQKSAQVSKTVGIRAQQRQSARLTVLECCRDPDVGTNDRLDAARQRRAIELHECE